MKKQIPADGVELAKVRNTVIYEGGRYQFSEKDCPCITGSVWEYHDIASVQFNQLKGKLFNLIEASIPDQTQQAAVKGLVKGFCNEHYASLVGDLSGLMYRLGIQPYQNDRLSCLAEPLEKQIN